MLKIYFDWNCITHAKDKYPYILSIAKECGDKFLFPFSIAHIRDLMVSHQSNNQHFNKDLEIFSTICGKHYLLFENGSMLPKFATPEQVIEDSGDLIEIIQKTVFITPEQYSSIKEKIQNNIPMQYLNTNLTH